MSPPETNVFVKGARVSITGGKKGKGVAGEVFWIGDNKFGEGKRYGVKGDDGETYWIAGEHLNAETGARPPMASGAEPALRKGDRVWVPLAGTEAVGEVFWVGASKRGDGTRVGVKDPGGETHWFDARQLRKANDDAPAARPAPKAVPVGHRDEPPPFDDGPGDSEPPPWGDVPAWEDAPAWDEPPPADEDWS